MRCKNTTPEFTDWVKEIMDSKEIFRFLNMPITDTFLSIGTLNTQQSYILFSLGVTSIYT